MGNPEPEEPSGEPLELINPRVISAYGAIAVLCKQPFVEVMEVLLFHVGPSFPPWGRG